jgi:hypothetical protein
MEGWTYAGDSSYCLLEDERQSPTSFLFLSIDMGISLFEVLSVAVLASG